MMRTESSPQIIFDASAKMETMKQNIHFNGFYPNPAALFIPVKCIKCSELSSLLALKVRSLILALD